MAEPGYFPGLDIGAVVGVVARHGFNCTEDGRERQWEFKRSRRGHDLFVHARGVDGKPLGNFGTSTFIRSARPFPDDVLEFYTAAAALLLPEATVRDWLDGRLRGSEGMHQVAIQGIDLRLFRTSYPNGWSGARMDLAVDFTGLATMPDLLLPLDLDTVSSFAVRSGCRLADVTAPGRNWTLAGQVGQVRLSVSCKGPDPRRITEIYAHASGTPHQLQDVPAALHWVLEWSVPASQLAGAAAWLKGLLQSWSASPSKAETRIGNLHLDLSRESWMEVGWATALMLSWHG